MSKAKNFQKLINLLIVALRHKIGSIVNEYEIYAQKYAKDAEILLNEVQKVALRENWNLYDKIKIRETLKKKLKSELESKTFLNDRKFKIMEREIDKILKEFGLMT